MTTNRERAYQYIDDRELSVPVDDLTALLDAAEARGRAEGIEESARWVCTMAMSVSACHPVDAAKIALEMHSLLLATPAASPPLGGDGVHYFDSKAFAAAPPRVEEPRPDPLDQWRDEEPRPEGSAEEYPYGKDCPLCRGGINAFGHTRPCYDIRTKIARLEDELRALREAAREVIVLEWGDPAKGREPQGLSWRILADLAAATRERA